MSLSNLGYSIELEAGYRLFLNDERTRRIRDASLYEVHPSLERALYYAGHLIERGQAPFLPTPQGVRTFAVFVANAFGGLAPDAGFTLVLPQRKEAEARQYDGLAWRTADA
jgi:hypothetical protein